VPCFLTSTITLEVPALTFCTVSNVELMKFAARQLAPYITHVSGVNPEPNTVSVNVDEARTDVGEIAITVGIAPDEIVNRHCGAPFTQDAAVVPPPEIGLITPTVTVAAEARYEAATVAVS
jgi:hypothetical protein